MKKILCVIVILVFSIKISAQTPVWYKSYEEPGGADFVEQYQTKLSPDQKVYVSGHLNANGTYQDIILKYALDGSLEWTKKVDNTNNLSSGLISIDHSGAVYQSGILIGDIEAAYLKKYTAQGDLEWSRTIEYPGNWVVMAEIMNDDSGNVFTLSIWNNLYRVAKYSPQGALQWIFTDTTNDNEVRADMSMDAKGCVYICSNPIEKQQVTKIDKDGRKVWKYAFKLSQIYLLINYFTTDQWGNSYILGRAESISTGECFILLTKLDSGGNFNWDWKLITPERCNHVGGLAVDSSLNVYLAGTLHANTGYKDSIITVLLDSNGNERWRRYFSGQGSTDDLPDQLFLDQNGRCYIIGVSNFVSGVGKILLLSYDSTGQRNHSINYTILSNGVNVANSIAVGKQGEVIVSGSSKNDTTHQRLIFTSRFSVFTGLNNQPLEKEIYPIYPNPASDKVYLNQSNPVQLKLLSMDGKVLKDIFLGPNESVDVTDLTNGMYIMNINQTSNIKLLIQH